MDYAKESLKMHYELKGKIEVVSRAKVDSKDALSLAYTPGVAQPCLEIQKDAVQQQKKKISGTVTDPDGIPVIGANVVIKGTTVGTVTDLDRKSVV